MSDKKLQEKIQKSYLLNSDLKKKLRKYFSQLTNNQKIIIQDFLETEAEKLNAFLSEKVRKREITPGDIQMAHSHVKMKRVKKYEKDFNKKQEKIFQEIDLI